MKHRRVFVALFCAFASAVAAPQAAAAEVCQYRAQDLPLPTGITTANTYGGSENNKFVVGSHGTDQGGRGVLWENGMLGQMTPPTEAGDTVTPRDVNNSGLVVGSYFESRGANSRYRPVKYWMGSYEFLSADLNEEGVALGVNENGDVIGEVWSRSDPTVRLVVLWPNGQPRRVYPQARVIGLTNDRKLVVVASQKGWIINGDTGTWTQLPGIGYHAVLDHDRVLYTVSTNDGSRIVERDVNAVETASYDGGIQPLGRNSGGTLLGLAGPGITSLWQNGVRSDLNADKSLSLLFYSDVTDSGELVGTYDAGGENYRPARWFWVCT